MLILLTYIINFPHPALYLIWTRESGMHHLFISNNSVTVCPRFYIGNWHIVIFKAAPPLGSYFGRPTGIGEQHTESGGEKTLGQTVHNHS